MSVCHVCHKIQNLGGTHLKFYNGALALGVITN
jgi:hypothetical protein